MEWPSRLPLRVSDSKPTAHPVELFGKEREEPRPPHPTAPPPQAQHTPPLYVSVRLQPPSWLPLFTSKGKVISLGGTSGSHLTF